MSQTHSSLNKDQGQFYLEQLDAMREEFCRSMLAISGNSLQVFEDSLRRQEVLCVSLTRLLQTVQGPSVDPGALTSIQSASNALKGVNRTYAALVKQCRDSTALMYALCRSHADAHTCETGQQSPTRYSFEA